jgi:hypothetical protein
VTVVVARLVVSVVAVTVATVSVSVEPMDEVEYAFVVTVYVSSKY